MTWEDPIVAEVRKTRDRIAAEHQYDIRAIGRYYQEKQKQETRPVIRRSPRNDNQDNASAHSA